MLPPALLINRRSFYHLTLREFLEALGYAVHQADTALGAIARLTFGQEACIVLLDWVHPETPTPPMQVIERNMREVLSHLERDPTLHRHQYGLLIDVPVPAEWHPIIAHFRMPVMRVPTEQSLLHQMLVQMQRRLS